MKIHENGLIIAINYDNKKVIDSIMFSNGEIRRMTAPTIGAYTVEAWPARAGRTSAGGWL